MRCLERLGILIVRVGLEHRLHFLIDLGASAGLPHAAVIHALLNTAGLLLKRVLVEHAGSGTATGLVVLRRDSPTLIFCCFAAFGTVRHRYFSCSFVDNTPMYCTPSRAVAAVRLARRDRSAIVGNHDVRAVAATRTTPHIAGLLSAAHPHMSGPFLRRKPTGTQRDGTFARNRERPICDWGPEVP